MKNSLFAAVILFISLNGFSQKSKKNNPDNDLLRSKIDSLELMLQNAGEILKREKDSLVGIITDLKKNKQESTRKSKNSDLYSADYILIGYNKWAATNFGGSSLNFSSDYADDWLSDNNFYRCLDEEEWIEKINSDEPAYFVLEEPLYCVGYFFNLRALKKLQNNPPNGWRIAKYEDFNDLFNHIVNLKIKSTTPFQLLAGNYSQSTNIEAKKKLCWTGQIVNDIYNLSLFPVSYFSGFVSLLTFNNSLNLFSRFDEETNKIYYTEIGPNNKLQPAERRFGSEAYDYGFLVRLIKK
jgi:hypothetical protein